MLLLLDDYRIADIILLMLLTQGQGHALRNSVMFTSKFYVKFLSFAYNSAATQQKLFIFGMWVPGRVFVLSTSMDPWVMPQGGARGQNLGHPQ